MGSVTFPQAGISIVATKVFDVMVALVEMEIEIAAAVGAFHTPGEYARLLCDRGLFPACASFEGLHLFPCRTVNDGLVDIEEDCPVFFRVFNAPLHFVGLGVAFEVDNVTAVFLHGEDFLDCGMAPLARLQCAFGSAPAGAFAAPVIGRIFNLLRHGMKKDQSADWPATGKPPFRLSYMETPLMSQCGVLHKIFNDFCNLL